MYFLLYLIKIEAMKKLLVCLCLLVTGFNYAQQTVKSKNLKLKYTPPLGWNAKEFGGVSPWEERETDLKLCNCSGVLFTKSDKEGQLNVLVYPSTVSGLDSTKRNNIGKLQFADVQKYEKTKNKHFSFEVKRSNFLQMPFKTKSYDVIRYFAKVEDHYYIIFAWQENTNALNSTSEKTLYEMVNAIEPMN